MSATETRTNSLFRRSLAHPIMIPLALLAIAVLFRIVDIFFLPLAEQTGEAFVHKVLGFMLVLGYLWPAGRCATSGSTAGTRARRSGSALCRPLPSWPSALACSS